MPTSNADHLPIQIAAIHTTAPPELNVPPVLYKYRDSRNEKHWTALTVPELFLSSPASFEDQADCQIKTDINLLTTRERIQWVYDDLPRLKPGIERNPQKRLREAQRWALRGPMNDPAHVERVHAQAHASFMARMGVLSMTANPARLEMWESYAADFTGFCVGFKAETFYAYGGGPAQYTDVLPVFKGNEDPMYWMLNQTYVKHSQYAFEEEYRIHKFWPASPAVSERKIIARPDLVAEVIIGYQAPAKILELCQQHLPNVPIRIARPDGNGGVILTLLSGEE